MSERLLLFTSRTFGTFFLCPVVLWFFCLEGIGSPFSSEQVQEKKILFTFDHLPAMRPLIFWRPREVSNMILRTLQKHRIKAAGFVVEEKIDDDRSTYVVLDDWASRGHIVGNQTYGNADLNLLSATDFLDHVQDGQKYLWRISRTHPFNFRYLRFPYLHQGNDERKKREVAKVLYNAGYEVAAVTVKTSDHHFNRPYVDNEQDLEKVARLKVIYLEHLSRALDYAESQSEKVFGRNISHILWLHCGLATAHFLDDLIARLKSRGYEFIGLTEALSDTAFQTEENYVGPLGLSFIDRVAATRGLPFDENSGELSSQEIEKRLNAQ